jgi:hypothetical protein
VAQQKTRSLLNPLELDEAGLEGQEEQDQAEHSAGDRKAEPMQECPQQKKSRQNRESEQKPD